MFDEKEGAVLKAEFSAFEGQPPFTMLAESSRFRLLSSYVCLHSTICMVGNSHPLGIVHNRQSPETGWDGAMAASPALTCVQMVDFAFHVTDSADRNRRCHL